MIRRRRRWDKRTAEHYPKLLARFLAERERYRQYRKEKEPILAEKLERLEKEFEL